MGFPGVSDGKESACNVEDSGSIPGLLKRFPGEENGNPLQYSFFFFSFQYSCLDNSMDRGARWATVHGITKSWTWLRDFHSLIYTCIMYNYAIIEKDEEQNMPNGLYLCVHVDYGTMGVNNL